MGVLGILLQLLISVTPQLDYNLYQLDICPVMKETHMEIYEYL
jgi:hypothetical protein